MSQNLEKLIASVLRYYDQNKLALLRDFCRKDTKNISELVDILLETIQSDDVNVRYNCVLLAEEFFKRSHHFRQRLIENLHNFLLYTVETDPLHYPIVGPQVEAKKLKNKSLKIVHEWHRIYGEFYTKLNLAMSYLKTCKTIDIERLRAETIVEKRREDLKLEKEISLRRSTTERIRSELEEKSSELKTCLKELENGLDLLFPKVGDDHFDQEEPNKSTCDNLSAHGILSKKQKFDLKIEIKNKFNIEETPDNSDLIKVIRDSYKILKTRFAPMIGGWLKNLTKIGSIDDGLVKNLIDYRERCSRLTAKFDELKFITEEEDEDDFVEVPDLSAENESLVFCTESTSASSTNPIIPEEHRVPTLILGVDFWDDDQPSTSSLSKADFDCHRFWRPTAEPDEDLLRKSALGMNSRKVTFCGTFEPVKRSCGALLPDGSGCKRMDRQKCPFHGKIEQSSTEPTCRSVKEEKSWKDAAFSDAQLINEIESAAGVELSDPKKKSKKFQVQKIAPTSRDRLMKKMSNRSSLKRVSATLNEMDAEKFRDKFSHQWNYSVSS